MFVSIYHQPSAHPSPLPRNIFLYTPLLYYCFSSRRNAPFGHVRLTPGRDTVFSLSPLSSMAGGFGVRLFSTEFLRDFFDTLFFFLFPDTRMRTPLVRPVTDNSAAIPFGPGRSSRSRDQYTTVDEIRRSWPALSSPPPLVDRPPTKVSETQPHIHIFVSRYI